MRILLESTLAEELNGLNFNDDYLLLYKSVKLYQQYARVALI